MTSDGIEFCIARYLLSAQQKGKTASTVSLINHIRHELYNLDDLLNAVYYLEKLNYIKSSRDRWIITEKGVDHFFRLEEADQ